MKINHYSFGKVIIDDKTYYSDVIIYPDHIDHSWWRREGHFLYPEDIEDAIRTMPEILVIGTGYSGGMRVPEDTLKFIKSKGIEEIYVDVTEKAIKLFNKIKDRKVVAALHLTC